MNLTNTARTLVWLSLGLSPSFALTATVYEWVDASGETHLGYRPPPGVVGAVVGAKAHQPDEPAACRELQEDHLRLIDKEIARLRHLSVGLGAEFEFTAEARQRFINDLLAHRAALITGRAPEAFAPPDNKRQLNDLKEKYKKDQVKLVEDLEEQARQLQRERRELDRQRRENESIIQRYRALNPGLIY